MTGATKLLRDLVHQHRDDVVILDDTPVISLAVVPHEEVDDDGD